MVRTTQNYEFLIKSDTYSGVQNLVKFCLVMLMQQSRICIFVVLQEGRFCASNRIFRLLEVQKFKRKEKLNRIEILLLLYDINDLLFLIQNH